MPLFECNTTLLEFNEKGKLPAFRDGIDERQYCAHDPIGQRESCKGDSGGPIQMIRLFSKLPKVIGIVSFGIGCGHGQPGIISIGLDHMFGQKAKLIHYESMMMILMTKITNIFCLRNKIEIRCVILLCFDGFTLNAALAIVLVLVFLLFNIKWRRVKRII